MCDFYFLKFVLSQRMRLSLDCTDQILDQIQDSKVGVFLALREFTFLMTFNTLLHANFFATLYTLNKRSIYFLKKKELDTHT